MSIYNLERKETEKKIEHFYFSFYHIQFQNSKLFWNRPLWTEQKVWSNVEKNTQ